MALSFIGAATADTTSVTVPAGHQAGDLMIVFAYRTSNTTPTLPTGWTTMGSAGSGGNAQACIAGFKVAGSAAESSGTWTNATGVMIIVLRGAATNKVPEFNNTPVNAAASATVNYATLAMKCPSTSWIVGMLGTKSSTSALGTPPSGLTAGSTLNGAASSYGVYHSNGVMNSWPSTNQSVTASATYCDVVVEVFAEQGLNNNYQFMKVGDGISTGEKVK